MACEVHAPRVVAWQHLYLARVNIELRNAQNQHALIIHIVHILHIEWRLTSYEICPRGGAHSPREYYTSLLSYRAVHSGSLWRSTMPVTETTRT